MTQGRVQTGHAADEHLGLLFPGHTAGEYLGLSPLSMWGYPLARCDTEVCNVQTSVQSSHPQRLIPTEHALA